MGESWAEAVRAVATSEERKLVVQAMLQAAKEGSVEAAKYLRDTQDGRPAQRHEITGDPDKPVGVIVRGPKEGS